MIAHSTGAAPRNPGRSDGCTLIMPRFGIASSGALRMWPYATTTPTSGASCSSCARNAASVGFAGCSTCRASAGAATLTGGGTRRLGRLRRLQHLQVFGERGDFDGRRNERGARAAVRGIGLRHDRDDVESLTDERAERGHGELRGAEKHDAHYSSPAGSGVTSFKKPFWPLRDFFHLASRRLRLTALRWSRNSTPSRWSISC